MYTTVPDVNILWIEITIWYLYIFTLKKNQICCRFTGQWRLLQSLCTETCFVPLLTDLQARSVLPVTKGHNLPLNNMEQELKFSVRDILIFILWHCQFLSRDVLRLVSLDFFKLAPSFGCDFNISKKKW